MQVPGSYMIGSEARSPVPHHQDPTSVTPFEQGAPVTDAGGTTTTCLKLNSGFSVMHALQDFKVKEEAQLKKETGSKLYKSKAALNVLNAGESKEEAAERDFRSLMSKAQDCKRSMQHLPERLQDMVVAVNKLLSTELAPNTAATPGQYFIPSFVSRDEPDNDVPYESSAKRLRVACKRDPESDEALDFQTLGKAQPTTSNPMKTHWTETSSDELLSLDEDDSFVNSLEMLSSKISLGSYFANMGDISDSAEIQGSGTDSNQCLPIIISAEKASEEPTTEPNTFTITGLRRISCPNIGYEPSYNNLDMKLRHEAPEPISPQQQLLMEWRADPYEPNTDNYELLSAVSHPPPSELARFVTASAGKSHGPVDATRQDKSSMVLDGAMVAAKLECNTAADADSATSENGWSSQLPAYEAAEDGEDSNDDDMDNNNDDDMDANQLIPWNGLTLDNLYTASRLPALAGMKRNLMDTCTESFGRKSDHNNINRSGSAAAIDSYLHDSSELQEGGLPMPPMPPGIHRECQMRGKQVPSKADLEQYYQLPMSCAASALGVGTTAMKDLCRRYDIKRWPYRKLASVDALIETVRVALEEDPEQGHRLLNRLVRLKEEIMRNPNVDLPSDIRALRQTNFKNKYKQKKASKERAGCGSAMALQQDWCEAR